MALNSKELKNVSVRTQAGTRLGSFASADFDQETGRLVSIRVAPLGALTRLVGTELIVAWNQVVSMSSKEIIVQDASVPYAATQFVPAGTHD